MIKTILFDFDETIYVGDIGDNNKMHDRQIVETCFGNGAYDDMIKKFGVDKKDIKFIFDICRKEGMDYKKVTRTFNKQIFIHKINNKIELLPNEFFEKLSKNYNLYVVSMSPINYLKHYFCLYNINKSCFKEILSMDLLKHNSKADLFKTIMKKEKIKPTEMLMIGDNIFNDIKPATELGINTLLFKGCFNQIYDYMTTNGICNCDEFKENRKFIYANK